MIDEVVFSLPYEQMALIEENVVSLQEMGITVRMVIDFYDIPVARKEIALFHDELPMLTFYGKAFDSEQLFLKRCLDIVGSLIGLGITCMLFPFIALAIKMESKGPLFFSQNRVGENGRIFKCWKLRSMFTDAEERKKDLMAQNEMQGAMFKMKDDPRVTRVGKFIRKTSIDELPQFWNVLQGEMSLVGTRPPTPDEVAVYENWQRKRICIKPGITGLWQVSGRNQIEDFDEVVRLDIRYIEEWSIWLDIKLLAKTLWVVVARRGAS
jgi:exopolysaccharide biosynthesis polyprenyl glycosylphosphotransferase